MQARPLEGKQSGELEGMHPVAFGTGGHSKKYDNQLGSVVVCAISWTHIFYVDIGAPLGNRAPLPSVGSGMAIEGRVVQ